jgi:hypothetical protein
MKCGCGHKMSEHGPWGCLAVVDRWMTWGLEASDNHTSETLCSCDRPSREEHRPDEPS